MYMNQEWRYDTRVYTNTNNMHKTNNKKNINHYNKCKNVYDPLTIKVLKKKLELSDNTGQQSLFENKCLC